MEKLRPVIVLMITVEAAAAVVVAVDSTSKPYMRYEKYFLYH